MLPHPLRRLAQALAACAALSLPVAVLADDTSLVSVRVEPAPAGPDAAPAPAPAQVGDVAVPLGADLGAVKLPALPPGFRPAAGAVVARDGLFYAAGTGADGRPALRRFERGEWRERAAPPFAVLPGAARPLGQAHLLFAARGPQGELRYLTYQNILDEWADLGAVPLPGSAETLTPVAAGFDIRAAAPGGAPETLRATVVMAKRALHAIDWILIVVYLAFSAGIGLWFYLREKKNNNTDFFLGGRNIPWWAAGLSLYATGTSAISYIAIPAYSFATNWQLLGQNVVGLATTAFVAVWIVPMIRRLDVMSVYHYLEMRFHPSIRVLASALNIVIQLGGRMSVVLFLPSLALSAVTGLDVVWSILLMGVVTIAYTLLGGMKAVIWTDVLQVFVMLGGAFFAIGYVIAQIDGGLGEFLRIAAENDKMKAFDWSFDLKAATMWGFIFLAVLNVITYPQDQVMMQRVLSTKDARAAGWSMWTLAAVVVPGALTFFAIGTALYVFYKQHPAAMNPLLSVDATFPHFIAAELPVGVTGLIIAGIFAASMSTLSSCMNSVATLLTVDFVDRFSKRPDEKRSVRLAEIFTVVAGVIGIGTALTLAFVDIKSALDKSFELASLLGGGFAGCYGLGMFTRRANWQGAVIGVVASLVLTFVAWRFQLVHSVFYMAISIFTCLVFGYVGSLFFPAPTQSLRGLTIFDPMDRPKPAGG
jgi:SSS family transporter